LRRFRRRFEAWCRNSKQLTKRHFNMDD
jgi:hypothetical protein